MLALAQLEAARECLERYPDDPALAVEFFKYDIEDAGLRSLAWLLAGERYGCSRNDVLGLLELLDQQQEQGEKNEGS